MVPGAEQARFKKLLVILVAAAAVFISAGSVRAANDGRRCIAPDELIRFKAAMPHFLRAFKSREPLRIVALGSSSTKGVGASTKRKSYPARLQAELRRRFPDKAIQVVNLGIGGELASDMLERIETQVFQEKPALVIWQTGVNDAIRSVELETFHRIAHTGIKRLRDHGIDVVLLDHQYYPGSARVRSFGKYLEVMRKLAREESVPLLSRYRIMRHLVTTGQYAMKDLLSRDKFHLNDTAYGCLGTVMADALQRSLTRAAMGQQ